MAKAPPEWLERHGVEPWAGERSLPLWLPLPEYAGFNTRDNRAALQTPVLLPRGDEGENRVRAMHLAMTDEPPPR